MIPINRIPDKTIKRARSLRPLIISTGERSYNLLSPISKNLYHIELDDPLKPRAFSCDCKAVSYCWHAVAVLEHHARRWLGFGDRVLVNELEGARWHRVIYATDRVVFTDEVPEGFSLPFVIEVESAMPARGAVAA